MGSGHTIDEFVISELGSLGKKSAEVKPFQVGSKLKLGMMLNRQRP